MSAKNIVGTVISNKFSNYLPDRSQVDIHNNDFKPVSNSLNTLSGSSVCLTKYFD